MTSICALGRAFLSVCFGFQSSKNHLIFNKGRYDIPVERWISLGQNLFNDNLLYVVRLSHVT